MPVSNGLSMYRCVDGKEEEIGKIAAALILKKGHLADFGYALIDEGDLREAGIVVDTTEKGNTGIASVDDRHVNLVELSAGRLYEIAKLVFRSTRGDIDQDDVLRYIQMSVDGNELGNAKIPEDIQKHLHRAGTK